MTNESTPAIPAGEYAIVEVLGHRTIVGRVEEVERFGTKLMSIEPLFAEVTAACGHEVDSAECDDCMPF